MLPQKFHPGDVGTQTESKPKNIRRSSIFQFFALCLCVAAVNLACGSKPADLRTVVPADALVYLETNDLGKTLRAVTENEAFKAAAKTVPDLSALDGMKLSVAVMGFQTTEQPVTDENSVLNFKPRFVAVVETNAWNYQAMSFTENKLGEFINDMYGGEVALATSDKNGGKYFVWTAQDGRKAYALVRGSLILFGNDESAINSCVNVMNGVGESIAGNSKVAEFASGALAAGYVSKDGVAQIANLAAVSLAIGAGEDGGVKNFIARVLPEIVRNSITEVTWTARPINTPSNIEDNYSFFLTQDVAKVLGETVVEGTNDPEFSKFIPAEYSSVTRYSLRDPQVAWRAAIQLAQAKTDRLSGGLIAAFSSALFEAYAVEDPEMFLSGVRGTFQTVRFDTDGDEAALVVRIKDIEKIKRSVARELDLSKPPKEIQGARIWTSGDGEFAAAEIRGWIVIGETESVGKCLDALGKSLQSTVSMDLLDSPIATKGNERDPEAKVIAALSDRKDNRAQLVQFYTSDTTIVRHGGQIRNTIERHTVSDFGLIGMIIARLDPDK